MNTRVATGNPFPGLRPFREDEEHLFFGRESQVDAMVDKLAASRFLAVVGTSGSGKSSLVNCGLRPALHRGLMSQAGTAWRMAQFRPGSDPIGAMARALAQDGVLFRDHAANGPLLVEILATSLRMSKMGLIDVYEQASLKEGVNLLVVVDQFEELFRYQQLGLSPREDSHGISEDAAAFVSLLLEVKEHSTCPIYVVLTMRSDFLGDCTQFPGLAEAINAGQYLVPRMTRDERRAAIVGPCAVACAPIAPVLVTRLVNDVGENPDQLSILQHALNRTWLRWQEEGGGKGALDLSQYEAIGTIANALDQHAEEAYGELRDPRQRQICEKVFKALTDKATDPRGIRRPTNLGTLCALADASAVEVMTVIDVFRTPSRSFLMPPSVEDAPKARTVIDISHESLMRMWGRLDTWADEESQSARMYHRLAETAKLHAQKKASLWRDPDLLLALDWRDQNQPNETWAERYQPGFRSAMSFLEASVALREGEEKGLNANMMQRLERFGYRIEDRVDAGGFGLVYRARQVIEGRTVALKILNDEIADQELFVGAVEEAKRLNHEGIVSILEVHRDARPAFFVMEWIDGRPITAALADADWNAISSAVAAVCESMEYAHRRGVIHGDLKPGNLLVARDGKPKVLNCGVRRLLGNDVPTRTSLAVPGNALYVAPEQVRGRTRAGPAVDIYALGVILYELLTGEPPFVADSVHRVLDAHLHAAPELPMLKREDVPEPLQRICLKALEKTPADRYHSMNEMREDLERYRLGKAVLVRPSYYNNLIESPARGHVTEIDRWRDQALITDSEHVRLRRAYHGLTRSGLQAVSESRLVHGVVLSMYLGGWLVLAGAASWLALYYTYSHADKATSLWFASCYSGDSKLGLGLANCRGGRVLVGLVPALLTNALWYFFNRRGSYRFAFAAMILGLLSLPFSVGVTVHEIAEWLRIPILLRPVTLNLATDHVFKAPVPNTQLFIALLVAVIWDTYVARQSRTFASAAIAGVHFVVLYLIGLDFWGLVYLFHEKISYGGLYLLPSAVALVAAGLYVARKLDRPGQAVPLFAIAMAVAILASQAIAWNGPPDWGVEDESDKQMGIGAIEVAMGIGYFLSSRYLHDRLRVEAAQAYRVLMWLAPVAFLGGIGLLDYASLDDSAWTIPLFLKHSTPWAAVLLASSICVVLLAARVQSFFYISCGLGFLAYILERINYEVPRTWVWPFAILCAGLVLVAALRWWDSRERVGEDIDDVGESLIRRSRAASSTAGGNIHVVER